MPAARNATKAMVRGVAVLEGTKGLLVLLAGAGLLTLLHRDMQAWANDWIAHLHLNPANRYPRIFVALAEKLTDARLWGLAVGAFVYAVIRLIEAYGLWRQRRWAEWLGALSAGVYVPLELYSVVTRPNWLHVLLVLVNAGIVGILVWVLRQTSSVNESRPPPAPRRT